MTLSRLLRLPFTFAKVFPLIPPADYLRPAKLNTLRKTYPFSMAGYKRLANSFELAEQVERDGVPGALVECGVWRGGCAGTMAHVAQQAGSGRKIWLFDSFEGLPEPTREDGQSAAAYSSERTDGKLTSIGKCVGPVEDVHRLFFDRLRIEPSRVEIRKGWFQKTLPVAAPQIGSIAVLRLDGDWYESLKCCLDNLYDLLSPGAFVIIDDYGYWEGARKAVDEFLDARGLDVKLVQIDDCGYYFQVPARTATLSGAAHPATESQRVSA